MIPSRLRVSLLAGLAVAVYANTLGHGFVYDDFLWVVDQPMIHSLRNVPAFFATGQLLNRVYRPVALLSFSLDYWLAGLRPWFYHAENVLLHAAVTVLVYRLLRRLGEEKAWLAAAFFAVLPVHTEVVANITSRSELLATLLGLLALSQADRPLLAGALLVPALLAKESAIALPLLAPLFWWARPERPSPRRMWSMLGSLGAAVLAYLAVRALAHCCDLFPPQFLYAVDNPLIVTDRTTRLRTGLVIVGQNLALCFAPYHLSADYSFPQIPLVTGWTDGRFLFWLSFLVAAVAGAVALRRTNPDFARGLAWFFVAVAPVSNLPIPIGTIRAERLLYLPSLGACLILAEAISVLRATRPRRATALLFLLLASFGGLTVKRNPVWRSQESFFGALVADAPRSAKAHFELAGFRMRSGDCAAAVPSFQRALELFPRFPLAQQGLAACLARLGDFAGARALYQSMAQADPGDRELAEALARVCQELGDRECAITALRRLLASNRDAAREPGAWVALGNTLLQSGRLEEAETAYRRAIGLGATPVGHFNLAGLLVRWQRFPEAVAEYQSAAQMGLNREEVYVDWASAQGKSGDADGARRTATRGLQRFPHSEALKKLAR